MVFSILGTCLCNKLLHNGRPVLIAPTSIFQTQVSWTVVQSTSAMNAMSATNAMSAASANSAISAISVDCVIN
eukprot:4368150-Lingulodinium_polyedra.AAC.1